MRISRAGLVEPVPSCIPPRSAPVPHVVPGGRGTLAAVVLIYVLVAILSGAVMAAYEIGTTWPLPG